MVWRWHSGNSIDPVDGQGLQLLITFKVTPVYPLSPPLTSDPTDVNSWIISDIQHFVSHNRWGWEGGEVLWKWRCTVFSPHIKSIYSWWCFCKYLGLLQKKEKKDTNRRNLRSNQRFSISAKKKVDHRIKTWEQNILSPLSMEWHCGSINFGKHRVFVSNCELRFAEEGRFSVCDMPPCHT